MSQRPSQRLWIECLSVGLNRVAATHRLHGNTLIRTPQAVRIGASPSAQSARVVARNATTANPEVSSHDAHRSKPLSAGSPILTLFRSERRQPPRGRDHELMPDYP